MASAVVRAYFGGQEVQWSPEAKHLVRESRGEPEANKILTNEIHILY
jgi:hypothetical protein